MAIPNIGIPPLIEGQRIEDWQPLFVAATSTLVATAGEKAAVQILPSLVCRDAFERNRIGSSQRGDDRSGFQDITFKPRRPHR